jgi:hypothetical protein
LAQLTLGGGGQSMGLIAPPSRHQRSGQGGSRCLVERVKRQQPPQSANTGLAVAGLRLHRRELERDGAEILPLGCEPRSVLRTIRQIGVFQQVSVQLVKGLQAKGAREFRQRLRDYRQNRVGVHLRAGQIDP